MRAAIPVTDDMIAREFRLQRCRGSAMAAITNPAVRRVLELGAKVRAAREAGAARPVERDAKSRAANDLE
ncbi:hypothetical protein B0G76_2879 [Paraburkholderia sp. BL23I1N1]|uniref:hypothetical protein n=1 Tax=Paraburkholderia sp. BL23I1N1 TaxID=1938802 RepID=UPI000E73A294|nr:hypothetical protein [Paraburkholderia sp. BL23I1N1]RKE36677.1 hypothetical protein B0G76_2879 [Paraburkholderia sp. BL23I1N1]